MILGISPMNTIELAAISRNYHIAQLVAISLESFTIELKFIVQD